MMKKRLTKKQELIEHKKCKFYINAFEYLNVIDKDGSINLKSILNVKFTPLKEYLNAIFKKLIENNFIKHDYVTSEIDLYNNNSELNLYVLKDFFLKDDEIDDIFTSEMWKEIGKWECIEYLFYHLEDLYFNHYSIDRVFELYDKLLYNFSIGQLFNISYASIESALYQLRKGQISEDLVYNYVLDIIAFKARRSIDEGFKYYSFNRSLKCSQSEMSKYFFHHILGKDETYLHDIP